jgi:serine/threonine protein kinase
MPVPSTVADLINLVRQSGVVGDERLGAYLQRLQAKAPIPNEPEALARLLIDDGLLTRFHAEQLLQGRWRGFRLGKYQILERLGAGGMSSVFLGEHIHMRRRVAIKVLPMVLAADPWYVEQFYREARAVGALDHPNIVRAHDVDREGELHYLVLEYVDGACLQSIISKNGPMHPHRAVHYIRQAALGLAHIHHAGLVHRDVKPSNLLLNRHGTIKILDMGLACSAHNGRQTFASPDGIPEMRQGEDGQTKSPMADSASHNGSTKGHGSGEGSQPGTAVVNSGNTDVEKRTVGSGDYLAPEQILSSEEVDARADLYSLGATLYFLLTGKPPFPEAALDHHKLMWHLTRHPKPIRALRPEIPPGLSMVVDKMMAKNPWDRYQSAFDVANVLSPWNQPVLAAPLESEMPFDPRSRATRIAFRP